MNRVSATYRAIVVALVLVALSASAGPADAECLAGEVEVHRSGQTSITPVPAGTCLVPTPWTRKGSAGVGYRDYSMPTGVPNGFDVYLWLAYP